MDDLVRIDCYPIQNVLTLLLKDKTTKKNIVFATDAYTEENPAITEKTQITEELLLGLKSIDLQPRVRKSLLIQNTRTRRRAEVFTPSWICNKMNNNCDTEWFGREGVFNIETGQKWVTNIEKIEFENEKGWKKYVDSKRLEITCGEAPYIISRYDSTTGVLIPIQDRIGILDRKMRVVGENTFNEAEWIKWALRAYESVYGYEFQGDNLLIARMNLIYSFVDYMKDKWNKNPDDSILKKLANIVVWNFWQMDGITGTVPYGKPKEEYQQLSFFDYEQGINDTGDEAVYCRIMDWRADRSITYRSISNTK